MDIAGLPAWVGDVGPLAGLVLAIGVALIRGWLVPGVTVRQWLDVERGAASVQRERADEWRAVAETQRLRAEEAERMSGTLLAGFETHAAILRSIQTEALRRGAP
jgi:hypothetical protein